MKTEFIIFAVLAMVASFFLNADGSTQASSNLASVKHRIENSGQIYAKSQQIKTALTDELNKKPNKS